jgi:predicted transcriptional regulator
MTPKKIRILLMENDVRQARIADQLGVSRTAVSNVIKGIVESRRIKNAIASAVGKKLEELWPSENKTRRAA